MKSSRRRPPQISLGFLLLMMVVFAVMSAGMLYASRVDAIQDELNMLFGETLTPNRGSDRRRLPHLVFIMFTLTSPLILAGVLSTGMSLARVWSRRR